MTNKELLNIDLCSRLPYIDTMVRWQDEDYHMISIGFGRVTLVKPFWSITAGSPQITEVKPYLRSMEDMTEEEKIIYKSKQTIIFDFKNNKLYVDNYYSLDWLNKHHFDYRGLIEKGLALEAPEDMYN